MAKTVTEILKESTKDLLTEETLNQIETIFSESVDKKVSDQAALQLESALLNQDEQHAKSLKTLLEKIDVDHSAKLEKVVSAITENHTRKLKSVIGRYQTALNSEAKVFKESLISNISQYLELYLEKLVPTSTIEEAVKNKKAARLIKSLRESLGVDFAFSKKVIKEGVLDGKQQLTEAQKEKANLIKENTGLLNRAKKAEATLLIETMSGNLPKEKKDYVTKVLCDKDPEFIKENFTYTVELFEKNQEETLETLREEVTPVSAKIDRPIKETLIKENVNHSADPQMNVYITELDK